jgi:carboxyl-terminal processing protease
MATLRFLRTEETDHAAKKREEKREPTEQEKAARLAGEFEIRLARRILGAAKGRPDAAKRSGLLEAAKSVIAKAAPEEERSVAAAFAARSVDWSDGAAAAGSTAKLVAKLPQGQVLKAGEKTGITVAVTNTGSETLHRIWGRTESANPLLRNQDFAFGALAPGQTREWTLPLEVPGAVEERWDTVSVKLQAAGAEPVTIAGGSVETKARPAPEYAYRYTVADENPQDASKSGDGRIEIGERVRLTLEVTNRGGAESPKLEVNLSADEKEELYLEEARRKVENLTAGTAQSAPLSFKVVRPLESGRVKVGLSFSDRGAGGFFADGLELPTAAPYTAVESRVPPRITLAAAPPLVTGDAQVNLEVSTDDDAVVKDVIVYRGEKKISYSRNRENAAPFPVSVAVPLEEGSNRLLIMVRDDKDIPAQKVLYIHRRGGDGTIAASAPAAPAQP